MSCVCPPTKQKQGRGDERRVTSVHRACFFLRPYLRPWEQIALEWKRCARPRDGKQAHTHWQTHWKDIRILVKLLLVKKWSCGSDLLWKIQSARTHFEQFWRSHFKQNSTIKDSQNIPLNQTQEKKVYTHTPEIQEPANHCPPPATGKEENMGSSVPPSAWEDKSWPKTERTIKIYTDISTRW